MCWSGADPDDDGCTTSDILAAIDDTIADNVDVINFSVGGGASPNIGADDLAYEGAAEAGIFVAASAGNSGPDESTVNHGGPWLMTVAAGTKDREFRATVVLGNGTTYAGIGNGAAVPSAPLVLAADVAAAGADPDDARRCYASIDGGLSLDPAKTAGKIVVCDRGGNNRTSKSLAVKEAGGVGMVLTNTSVNSLNADIHYVPTVHLAVDDRAAIRAYAATAGATASLTAGTPALVAAPEVAGFSSRGPIRSAGSNILKPDIMAPGVDVLAAVSPVAYGRNFDFYSGTSMSAPHLAGSAAILLANHPDWSPAEVKSALTNTADDVVRNAKNGLTTVGPMAQGAGRENLGDANTAKVAFMPVSASYGKISATRVQTTPFTFTLTNHTGSAILLNAAATRFDPTTGTVGAYGGGSVRAGVCCKVPAITCRTCSVLAPG